jgi:hypothetical protein
LMGVAKEAGRRAARAKRADAIIVVLVGFGCFGGL